MPQMKLWRVRVLSEGKKYAVTVAANNKDEAINIVKAAMKRGKLVVKKADEITALDSGYTVSRQFAGIEH